MNVFVQGMRRSGTTIVFDLFLEDGRFDCYYEPLAAANRPAHGGGSGAHSEDFFEKVRATRREFVDQRADLEDASTLNYGAPRKPSLELETVLPDVVREYIRYMCEKAENTVIKFTRMGCKVEALHEIDPRAHLVHVVRDPRAVATSHLYGKGQQNRNRFRPSGRFFRRQSPVVGWSAHAFADALLLRPEYSHLGRLRDFERVLLVWKHLVRATHDAGQALFGDRYCVVRHEDMANDPDSTLRGLYAFLGPLGQGIPDSVVRWASENVRGGTRIHDRHSRRWVEAIRRLDAANELRDMGYEESP
jgi:hypothetical protein